MKTPMPFKKTAQNLYVTTEAVSREDIIAMGRKLLVNRHRKGSALKCPQDSRNFLRFQLAALEHEVFACIFLNTRHQIITFEKLFFGTIDGASVYSREVVKAALKHNAAAVIFAHNHPSGVSEPSTADCNLTRRLIDALQLVDIRVLDHFVVSNNSITSFAEKGLL